MIVVWRPDVVVTVVTVQMTLSYVPMTLVVQESVLGGGRGKGGVVGHIGGGVGPSSVEGGVGSSPVEGVIGGLPVRGGGSPVRGGAGLSLGGGVGGVMLPPNMDVGNVRLLSDKDGRLIDSGVKFPSDDDNGLITGGVVRLPPGTNVGVVKLPPGTDVGVVSKGQNVVEFVDAPRVLLLLELVVKSPPNEDDGLVDRVVKLPLGTNVGVVSRPQTVVEFIDAA